MCAGRGNSKGQNFQFCNELGTRMGSLFCPKTSFCSLIYISKETKEDITVCTVQYIIYCGIYLDTRACLFIDS